MNLRCSASPPPKKRGGGSRKVVRKKVFGRAAEANRILFFHENLEEAQKSMGVAILGMDVGLHCGRGQERQIRFFPANNRARIRS